VKIKARFDGLTEPRNPGGIACYGVYIMNMDTLDVNKIKGYIGEGPGMSNNVAEYSGLVALLEWLIENGFNVDPHVVEIAGDSQLVINQINGAWRVKGGMYLNTYLKAKNLLKQFSNKLTFTWIPREKNEEADQLSKESYVQQCELKGIKPLFMQTRSVLVDFYEKPSQVVMKQVESRETCKECKWIHYSGPHVGCYPEGKYRKWLSKQFAENDKCELFKPRINHEC
jgi:ribonuclease HI